MARRVLEISEEFGVYRLTARGIAVTGSTPEKVIFAAWKVRAMPYEGSHGEPDVHSTHDMGEVLETLLGPHVEETGVVSVG